MKRRTDKVICPFCNGWILVTGSCSNNCEIPVVDIMYGYTVKRRGKMCMVKVYDQFFQIVVAFQVETGDTGDDVFFVQEIFFALVNKEKQNPCEMPLLDNHINPRIPILRIK